MLFQAILLMKRFSNRLRWPLAVPLTSLVLLATSLMAQEELPGPLTPESSLRPLRDAPPVNQSLTGWYEAGIGEALGDRIRSHWVMLGQNGDLAGTVRGQITSGVPLDILALKRGTVVAQTRTDASGNFRLDGLTEGAYSLLGYSPNRLFTWGVNLLAYRAEASGLPRRMDVRALDVANKITAGRLVQEGSPQIRFRSFGPYPFGQDDPQRSAWFGWQGLKKFPVPALRASTIQTRSIRLAADGVLRGRVHQIDHLSGRPLPVSQTKATLLEEGEIVAAADCNRLGVFEFSGLPSGNFGVVITGSDGFAALEIQVTGGLDPGSAGTRPVSGARLASRQRPVAAGQPGPWLDVALVQPESAGWINHFLGENQFAEARAQPRLRTSTRPCCVYCRQILSPGQPCGCHR
jgi:hypothetical protein